MNATAGFRGRPEATLHADRLILQPGWLSLFRGRFAWISDGGGLRRRGPGARRLCRLFTFRGPLSAEANFREIRIEKCAWLRDALARQITGTLKGSFSFSGAAER